MMDKKIISKVLKTVGLKKGDVFYDLGCGNGDVLVEASKFGAMATGFEISPYFYLLGKVRIFLWKIYNNLRYRVKSSINITIKDVRKVELSKADVVYVYLLPKILEKLSSKFKKEMKKGSTLISVGFPIVNLKSSKELKIKNHKIYIYKF